MNSHEAAFPQAQSKAGLCAKWAPVLFPWKPTCEAETPYLKLTVTGWDGGGCISVRVTQVLGQRGMCPAWCNLKGKESEGPCLGNKVFQWVRKQWSLGVKSGGATLQGQKECPQESCLLFSSSF